MKYDLQDHWSSSMIEMTCGILGCINDTIKRKYMLIFSPKIQYNNG